MAAADERQRFIAGLQALRANKHAVLLRALAARRSWISRMRPLSPGGPNFDDGSTSAAPTNNADGGSRARATRTTYARALSRSEMRHRA
jgi:hypothetical protein